MMFCQHFSTDQKQAIEQKYSEEFKKYVIGIDCGKCPTWFASISQGARDYFEKNYITEKTVIEAQDQALISFDEMAEILKGVVAGVAA